MEIQFSYTSQKNTESCQISIEDNISAISLNTISQIIFFQNYKNNMNTSLRLMQRLGQKPINKCSSVLASISYPQYKKLEIILYMTNEK